MHDSKVFVPPLKIQGIKTKLVPTIREYVVLDKDTLWIEPFMGSGVVGFNNAPHNAIFADINPHIINFYKQIQEGNITPHVVRAFLENEGEKLSRKGVDHYLCIRERFNKEHSPLDFLFLNRSCFNGMMRFNKNNEFNVPYGHKPERFAKAYITKIVNQVEYASTRIRNNNWTFLCQTFAQTIAQADSNSFIYCDPPYIGRHVDYYDSWNEHDEYALCKCLVDSSAKFMLSTWESTKFRENEYIQKLWGFCDKKTKEHFYHIGAKEANRNSVTEALLMNYTPFAASNGLVHENEQLTLF